MRQSKKADDPKEGTLLLPFSQMMTERGSTGLNAWGGNIGEEFLTQLQGQRGYEKYREMRLNNAVVGAVLFAIEQILLSADLEFEPGEGPDADQALEFLQGCFDDMDYTWRETMSEAISFLPYGYSLMEIVLKKRKGNEAGMGEDGWPLPASDYDDGKFGWAKFAIRGQETIDRWEFDPHGEVVGVWQRDVAKISAVVFIPRSKLLHFKTTSTQGNPEGQSILRTAYRDYFYATRVEEIEAIGIERNLNGLPVLTPAEGVDLFKANDTTMTTLLNYAKKMITGIRRDSNMGVIKPYGWVLELMRAGGGDPVDTGKVIDRHNWAIARCVLAQFLEQGRQQTGSYSAKLSDTQLFLDACKGWHKMMAQEIQMRAVVPLLTVYNGFRLTKAPTIQFANIAERDVTDVAEAIKGLTEADWLRPTDAGRIAMAKRLSLPEPTEEELEEGSAEDAFSQGAGEHQGESAEGELADTGAGEGAAEAGSGTAAGGVPAAKSVNAIVTGV